MVGGLWDLKAPLASHSRRVSLGTLAPSAPCFGSFTSQKHHTVMFLLAHPLPPPEVVDTELISATKRKNHPIGWFSFGCGGGI